MSEGIKRCCEDYLYDVLDHDIKGDDEHIHTCLTCGTKHKEYYDGGCNWTEVID